MKLYKVPIMHQGLVVDEVEMMLPIIEEVKPFQIVGYREED